MLRAACSVVAMALLAGVGPVAHAQVRAAPVTTPVATPLRLRPVSAPAGLVPRLSSKKRFVASNLQVSYAGNAPIVTLASGKKYTLLTEADTPLEAVGRTGVVTSTPEIEKRKAEITAWKPGIRATNTLQIAAASHVSTQSPIRDQGARGTCVAFSNMSGMEAWLKRNQGVTRDFSENHAHQVFLSVGGGTCDPGKGVGLKSMLGIRTTGVCDESAFAYTNECPTAVPDACANATDRQRITKLYPLSWPEYASPQFDAHNPSTIEALIDSGLDIVYSTKVAGTDWSDGTAPTGVIDVQIDGSGNPVGAYAAHNILLVGYNRPGQYVIFKNSWSAAWGHQGYGHMSYDYLETYGRYGYALAGVGP